MIRLAFVGLGWWGKELGIAAQILSSKISFGGCYSLSKEEMREFSTKFETKSYNKFDEILLDPEINGVVLATPHSQHADQIVKAASAGKHVFVEKPLALNTAAAKSAVKCCEDHDVILAVGHNRRFSPAAKELSKWISKNRFGQLLHVEAHFSGNSATHFDKTNWRADRQESPCGSLVSIGLHMIDTIQWLLGPIDKLSCISKRKALTVDIDDITVALFELKNGMTGTFATSFATPTNSCLKIFGTNGSAEVQGDFTELIWKSGGDLIDQPSLPTTNTLISEFEAFTEACAGKLKYPVTSAEAINNVAVIEAMANSSSRGGDWVKIEF